jgi:hypothetical protein
MRLLTKEWKERLEKICIGVFTAIAVVVLGALIKGDELKGLSKLAAILRILNSGIPLWLFLIVLVAATLGGVRWFKSGRREIIHIQWKEEHCLWTVAHNGPTRWMQVMLSGFVTNSHPDLELIITSIYLEGTKPALSLYETIQLPAAHVCDEHLTLMVEPVLMPEGAPFRGNVILVDQFQRKHKAYIELKGHVAQSTVVQSDAK